MSTQKTPSGTIATETSVTEISADLIGSGQEGGVGDQVRAWWQRVQGGDMGALPAVGGFVVLTILFSFLSPFFLTERNFANLLTQAATLVMLAMALVFVLLLGEIDLSAGVTSGMTMALFIVLVNVHGVPWILALAAAFAVGILTGTFIGFFVARVGIPSFVVTLGLFLGYQGITLWIIGAGGLYRVQIAEITAIQNQNMPVWAGWVMLAVILAVSAATSFWDRARRRRAGVPNRTITLVWIKLGVIAVIGGAAVAILSRNRGQSVGVVEGVPIVVPFVLVILWIGTFVLDRTRYGRYLYAIGGNAEAARRCRRQGHADPVDRVHLLLDPRGGIRAVLDQQGRRGRRGRGTRDRALGRRRRRRRRREPVRWPRSPPARGGRRTRDRRDHQRPRPAQPPRGREPRGHGRRPHPRGDGGRGVPGARGRLDPPHLSAPTAKRMPRACRRGIRFVVMGPAAGRRGAAGSR